MFSRHRSVPGHQGRTALVLGLTALTALASVALGPVTAQAAPDQAPDQAGRAAADTPVVVDGGTVLPGRVPGKNGALGVTFGFSDITMAGGPYEQPVNHNYNRPMYRPKASDPDSFWDNYVEELTTAGVDFVAVDLRGFGPGNAVPDGAGDPRALTPLVDAIKRRGVADRLKIAALDDTPATLTDKKNRAVHHTGGYSPPFDIGDANGTGEGGYQYFWDNNQREFFSRIPDDMLYKVDGRPLIYEWSVNDFAFSNQGNGNLSKLLQYARSRAEAEFGVDPYYVVDSSWPDRDPSVISQIDGINNWFELPRGSSNVTYQPVIDNGQLAFGDGWDYRTSDGAGDYKNTYQSSTVAGASVTYSFIGTGIQYLARTAPDQGSVDVSVDGQAPVTVKLNTGSAPKTQQSVFEKSGLADGTHTIKVVNKSAAPVTVDGFRVLTGRSAALNGRAYGVATPGFRVVNSDVSMIMDPDHGRKLSGTLDATVNAGADLTLVEGFTDWEENAMLARTADGTYAERLTDYPNQMIDTLRRYSTDPFPKEYRTEAETADAFAGATPGSTWDTYRSGDIDVQPTGDTGGGWNVGDIAPGESLTWNSRPLQGTVKLAARVATPNTGAQVRFVVDGTAGPTVDVPSTGDWQKYTTVDAGTFQLPAGTHHTVRLEFPTGSLNANYWTATTIAAPVAPAPVGPTGPITGIGGKCVDLAGGSVADGTRAVLNTCATTGTQTWTVAPDSSVRVLGKCLTTENGGTANGTRVQIASCDGSKEQQWSVDSSNGYLVNARSGFCLEDADGSTADGNPLIIWACNPGDVGQKWQVPAGTSAAGPSGRIAGYNGKCVEAGADGTPVQLNTCGSAASQSWTVAADGTLRAQGKCMTVAGGATANGAAVQSSSCSGAASQKWQAQANGTLVGTQSGKCLDATGPSSANGTKLQIWACAASDNQIWGVPSSRPAGVVSGYGGKCAEVTGGTTANGTAVQLNTCGSGSAQSWTAASDGTLRALGKCMTVAGGATANGTAVQLATCSGAASQKWQAQANGTLVGTQSGKCLDATGPSSANGTKLQIWTCAASDNQLWKLPA
ncbi:DUF5010 domain-containing protein [Streptomyces sp. Tu 6176]|uniref:DUF5010 domain-containing protein n=1 Tax=Streptomyces sp. Tu 6176 TaxID=1470557 RepID=UPI000AFD7271|nr:DUF5010 domain-containing protein [Streptomyces sp. Tu 6176]